MNINLLTSLRALKPKRRWRFMFESGAAGEEGLPELESAFDLIFSEVVNDQNTSGVGQAIVTADSDTGPYTYAWIDLSDNSVVSTGDNIAAVTGPKQYRVEVTDVNSAVGRAYFTIYDDIYVTGALATYDPLTDIGSEVITGLAKFSGTHGQLVEVHFQPLSAALTYVSGLRAVNNDAGTRTITRQIGQTFGIANVDTDVTYALRILNISRSDSVAAGAQVSSALSDTGDMTSVPPLTTGLTDFIGSGDVTHLKFAWSAPIVTVSASGGNSPVPTWDFAANRPQASITHGLLYRIGPL